MVCSVMGLGTSFLLTDHALPGWLIYDHSMIGMYEGFLLTKKRSLDMETFRFITR